MIDRHRWRARRSKSILCVLRSIARNSFWYADFLLRFWLETFVNYAKHNFVVVVVVVAVKKVLGRGFFWGDQSNWIGVGRVCEVCSVHASIY